MSWIKYLQNIKIECKLFFVNFNPIKIVSKYKLWDNLEKKIYYANTTLKVFY